MGQRWQQEGFDEKLQQYLNAIADEMIFESHIQDIPIQWLWERGI